MPNSGNEEFFPHDDEYPNDPNGPHGVNTEEEKLEAFDGTDDESDS